MPDPESQNRDGRELTTAERFALVDVRQMEAKWNGLIDRVKALTAIDLRQVAIAVTDAEGAYMRLARAITRPERIVEPAGISLVEAMRDPAFVTALELENGGLIEPMTQAEMEAAITAMPVSIGTRQGNYAVEASA